VGRGTPKQYPQSYKEAAGPKPELNPDVPEEDKGDSSSRLQQSEEPREDEEKRRVGEKLRELEGVPKAPIGTPRGPR
jgi:hypothetical protein